MERIEFSLTPVAGKTFVGREAFIQEIVEETERIKSHIGFCIYGRRRVGKTSVLIETKHLLEKRENVVVAYLSLYEIGGFSVKNFVEEFINSIITAYQKKGLLPLKMRIGELLQAPLDMTIQFLKSVKIEANVIEHFKLILEYKEKDSNNADYLREAFNIGEIIAETTGTKCIIMLDEFPEIIKLNEGMQLVKMLRTQYERQKRTALIVAGSIRKTLDMVALSDTSPFYKQLVPKHLMPFTKAETEEFLKLYLGKVDPDYANRIYQLTEGLPFYLQFLGRSTNYSGNVESIIDKFIKEEGDLFFKEEFEKLTEKEKGIVIALCEGEKNLITIASDAKEPITTISRYLPLLIEDDVIVKESRGSYRLLDPLFGYWIQKVFKK